ncbi:hypothetical protein AK812_SmicGene22362 [Symbiodinium microadriaticum]|uniref:Uncharacterized protein n=1 Tax=Symbiodinium microadriaticum TaxID=2951 RepID=A0A1Q9DK38_SYMMI|nr:hypothetical protein AK812_SmicGene22362 [Symbiodinium microadriaticum]
MESRKVSSVLSEETSSWHSAFEPAGDKIKSSSAVGDPKIKPRKRSKSKKSGKSKGKKDNKEHNKISKKKRRKRSSSKVELSPVPPSNRSEFSRSVSPMLRDPMQFHRPAVMITSLQFEVPADDIIDDVKRSISALYPDPKKLFSNIIVHAAEMQSPKKDEDDMLDLGEDLVAAAKRQYHKTASASSLVLSRLTSESSTVTNGSGAAHPRVESAEDPGLHDFVDAILHQGLDAEKLPHQLEKHIPELHPVWSPHNIFEQAGERERGSSSCISVLALVKNRYDIFTEPQGKNVKLKQSQWEELQELVTWIEPDAQQLQAVLVLLAIRALGKSKAVLQQLPVESRRPERAVVQVMNGYENVVPSVRWLTQRSQAYVEEALLTHELFNLAQMLQGENCPANVKQLREHIELKGDAVFRFYILFLLGFMSGLAAGNGSRFMNAKNADSTIGGIRMLQRLMNVNPTSIYWGYMGLRATKLKLPYNTPEDMVLVRLACLARIQDDRGYQTLKNSWQALGARERTSLTDHFLADGIEEPAWVFEFLPNCVANAQANPVVGLTALLDVLTDLLYNLRSFDKSGKPSLMLVDLSDMGEFIAAVQNRFVFMTCISRSQLSIEKSRVRVEMSGGNWGRTTDPDTDLTSIAYTLQDLVQKQQFVEERLSLLGSDYTPIVFMQVEGNWQEATDGSVFERPCSGAPVCGGKKCGETIHAQEETFDGWVKLAGETGWICQVEEGGASKKCLEAMEKPRAMAVESLAKTPGRQMLEVVADDGVDLLREPYDGALLLGRRSFGEFLLADSQSYHGWVRLSDDDGWAQAVSGSGEKLLVGIRPDELQLTQSLGQDVPEEAQKEQLAAAADEAARKEAVRQLEAAALSGNSAFFCAALEVARQKGVSKKDIARANAMRALLNIPRTKFEEVDSMEFTFLARPNF